VRRFRVMMNGYSSYRQTNVMTADPKRLVIMCYEEAIRSLRLAAAMYGSKNYMAKGRAVQKTLDIIAELREALDFERGGTIATSLESLYVFMTKHILKSDQARDVRGFEQVASMLEQLKSAWESIFFGYEEAVPAASLPAGSKSPTGPQTAQSVGYVR
jgi:flagellar secretion chaperone FliS